MNGSPPPQMAVRRLRKLLIKAGLREDEADEFLARLREEFLAGSVKSDEERRILVERQLVVVLESNQREKPTNLERLKKAVCAIVLGVSGNAVWSGITTEFSTRQKTAYLFSPKDWSPEILIEWIVEKAPGTPDLEPLLVRTLALREKHYGLLDQRTAVSLDGLGMCLDALGRHHEAERLRSEVVAVELKLNRLHDSNTGAALSNLGICLFYQKRYPEAEQQLLRAFEIMKQCWGVHHLYTAAAIHNLYICLKRQGRLPHSALPQGMPIKEQSLRKSAKEIMKRKLIIVTTDALTEIQQELKRAVGLP